MTSRNDRQAMHWFRKSVYLLVSAGLAILGVIGLVLPVIPGLIFLFLAVLLLTRISTRCNSMAGGYAGFRHWRRRWHAMNMLQAKDRIRLGFWYCAAAVIRGVETGVHTIRHWLRSRSSAQ